jgi:riboflavin kinase/FMN adenylyltransferase
LYGKKITLNFVKRLRDEMKFNNLEELINQLNKDKKESLKILKEINK